MLVGLDCEIRKSSLLPVALVDITGSRAIRSATRKGVGGVYVFVFPVESMATIHEAHPRAGSRWVPNASADRDAAGCGGVLKGHYVRRNDTSPDSESHPVRYLECLDTDLDDLLISLAAARPMTLAHHVEQQLVLAPRDRDRL